MISRSFVEEQIVTTVRSSPLRRSPLRYTESVRLISPRRSPLRYTDEVRVISPRRSPLRYLDEVRVISPRRSPLRYETRVISPSRRILDDDYLDYVRSRRVASPSRRIVERVERVERVDRPYSPSRATYVDHVRESTYPRRRTYSPLRVGDEAQLVTALKD